MLRDLTSLVVRLLVLYLFTYSFQSLSMDGWMNEWMCVLFICSVIIYFLIHLLFFYLLLVTMVIFNHKTKCFVLTSLWLVNVLQYL